MKILFIAHRVPFPPNGGYPIVVHTSIKAAIDEGAEAHVFSLNPHKHYVNTHHIKDDLYEQVPVTTCTINTDITVWDASKNLFSSRSYNVSRFYKANAIAQLKNVLRQNSFDIIQLEGLFVVPYLGLIRQLSKAKVIYRAHNIEYEIWEHQAASEKLPLRRFYLKLLAKRLKNFELEHLNKFDAIATITRADMAQLKHLGCTTSIDSFAVAVNPDDYVPDARKVEHPSIFHIGSMDWLPNREGMEWFLDNVWQSVQVLRTGLKFHIAGKNITNEFEDYEEEDIIMHPDVEDAKVFVNSKSVMVVPLRSGSGMRVKIIEAMAMKKCIISTSLGAEGIRYEHAKNILIADTPDEFYKYILKCTTDRQLCEHIGENARKLVERDHHYQNFCRNIMAFYKKLIGA